MYLNDLFEEATKRWRAPWSRQRITILDMDDTIHASLRKRFQRFTFSIEGFHFSKAFIPARFLLQKLYKAVTSREAEAV